MSRRPPRCPKCGSGELVRDTVLKAHKTEVWNDDAWEEVDTRVSAEDRARTSTIWCEDCKHSWTRPSDDGHPTRRGESWTDTDPGGGR